MHCAVRETGKAELLNDPASTFSDPARAPRASRPLAPVAGTQRTRTGIEEAIATAARSTSVDFNYLVAQAQVESAMDPDARARTSTASGLFQFIESTWLGAMKRHGPRFGLGDVSAHIRMGSGGSAHVADPAQRQAILALRNDPQIASFMAAGLAEDNRAHLMPILGRQPDHSELYLAHFLGAGGAGRFLSAMQDDPDQSAADLFRRPAAANRAVFYEPNGSPRSLAGVMDFLGAKMARASNGGQGEAASFRIAGGAGFAQPPTGSGGGSSFGQSSGLSLGRPSALPTLAAARAPRSMSSLLGSSIAATGASERSSREGAQHVRRAYAQLRALGL